LAQKAAAALHGAMGNAEDQDAGISALGGGHDDLVRQGHALAALAQVHATLAASSG
jgi:hypothetical protein